MQLRLNTKFVQNGIKLNNLLLCICLLSIAFCQIGCEWLSVEGFRGDWYLDICNDYRLNRVNSKSIKIEKKDSNKSGKRSGIKNFFVTKYCVVDDVICVEGIQTKEWTISQDELKENKLSYYLIETSSDSISGPFESTGDIIIQYDKMVIPPIEEWIIVTDPPRIGSIY